MSYWHAFLYGLCITTLVGKLARACNSVIKIREINFCKLEIHMVKVILVHLRRFKKAFTGEAMRL